MKRTLIFSVASFLLSAAFVTTSSAASVQEQMEQNPAVWVRFERQYGVSNLNA